MPHPLMKVPLPLTVQRLPTGFEKTFPPVQESLRGTLKAGEPHPAAREAYEGIRKLSSHVLSTYVEAFASTAIEGNRLSEICLETLNRLLTGQPVSDRYLLGLAYTLRKEIAAAEMLQSNSNK